MYKIYMNINHLIGMLVIIAFCLLGYTHFENFTNEVGYTKSSLDDKEYLVRNMDDKEEAANVLAKIRTKLEQICAIMKEKYPDDESVKRMVKRFNPDNITEAGKNNQYTSYSVNKGEKLVFCIRQKDEKESLVDENTVTFVAIHELSHIMTKSEGHKQVFWQNFKFLLEAAKEANIYQPVDYKKNPEPYCGMDITDNPYFDM